MTNEKAIMCLEDMKIKVPIPKAAKQARENNEALDVAIKALQSAEPKKGRWQYNNKMGTFKIFTCDQCGWNSEAEFNYCPNCGSRNEVTE